MDCSDSKSLHSKNNSLKYFKFAVDENGLTFIFSSVENTDEQLDDFLKEMFNTSLYIGYVGSMVALKSPEYAVRIPGSKCHMVLVPYWCDNYIVNKLAKETMLILMDGNGSGIVVEDGTTMMRYIAIKAKLGYSSTPGGSDDTYHCYDSRLDDNMSLQLKQNNYDIWTCKPYNKSESIKERDCHHLELAIMAFKITKESVCRGNQTQPAILENIETAIMNGPEYWQEILKDPIAYFALKKDKREKE